MSDPSLKVGVGVVRDADGTGVYFEGGVRAHVVPDFNLDARLVGEIDLTLPPSSRRSFTAAEVRGRDDLFPGIGKDKYPSIVGGKEETSVTGRYKVLGEIVPLLRVSDAFGNFYVGALFGAGYQWTTKKYDVTAIGATPKQYEGEHRRLPGEGIHDGKDPISAPSWTTTDFVSTKPIESRGLFGRIGVAAEWRLKDFVLGGKVFCQTGPTDGCGVGFGLTWLVNPPYVYVPKPPPPLPVEGAAIKRVQTDRGHQITASLSKKGLRWEDFLKNIIAHRLYRYLKAVPVSWAIPIDDKTDPTKGHYEYYLATQVIQKVNLGVGETALDYSAIVHVRLDKRDDGQFYCELDTKDIKGEGEDSKINDSVRKLLEKKENIDRLEAAMKDAKLDTSGDEPKKRLKQIFDKFEENVRFVEGSLRYDPKTGYFVNSQHFNVKMEDGLEAIFEKLNFGPVLAGIYAVMGVPPATDINDEGKWRTVKVEVTRVSPDPEVVPNQEIEIKVPVAPE